MTTCCVLVLTERRIVALHEANRVRPCPGWLRLRPGETNFFFPLFLPLSLLPVSQLYMFNELASFLSVFISSFSPPPPTPLLHSITFPSMPALAFSCFSFSSPSNVLPAGIHDSPEGTAEEYHPLLSTTVLRILGANIHCPIFHAKGRRYARTKKIHCTGSNNGANKRALPKLGFTGPRACKNDNHIKRHILHFNLSTRIVLIRTHHHLK